MEKREYTLELGGKTFTAEFNDIANQAHGSVILRCGDTAVLATVVMGDKPNTGTDYFPLKVDYEERFYASGEILGSRFMRREGKPSDEAVLTGRVVDRTIRPLFNQKMRYDVQVVTTVLSIDEADPDVLAVNAVSLALATSDIPWNGPVSAVRIGKIKGDNTLRLNPNYEYRNSTDFEMDLFVCGKDGNVNMIEDGSSEISEDLVTQGLEEAVKELDKLQNWQKQIVKEVGRTKREVEIEEVSPEIIALFEKDIAPKLNEGLFIGKPGKEGIKKLHEDWKATLKENLPDENHSLASDYLEEMMDKELHRGAIEDDKRADGRGFDEIRPLMAKAGGISGKLHGSGLFYRGGTHVLSVLTLGGPDDALMINGMEEKSDKKFIHHYNFPPFSVGETGRVGNPGRREIGHGALAEKALLGVIPTKEEFPYTIRIVSEAFASNGSTSMASVCGSTLALMDAGVPIKRPVAGIASGLMMDDKGNYKLLTDIQGPEDHHGDMDFKVAGTREGITAIQMDVKVDGVPVKILSEALYAAKKARIQILDVIEKEISSPRTEINKNAPKILLMTIKQDQIGLVIGGGGKTIKDIKERSSAEITIEDDGTVYLTGVGDSTEKARAIIEDLVKEWKIGEEADATVVKIVEFGAFASIGGQTEGLIHISEIAPFRVEKVGDYLSEGEIVPVKISKIENGKVGLSIKARDPKWAEAKKALKEMR